MSDRVDAFEPQRLRALRRYVRSEIYYILASCMGCKLLLDCSDLHDLVHLFTHEHKLAFSMGLAHWLIALAEDASTPSSFRRLPGLANLTNTPVLYFGHLLHHGAAALAFAFCLSTHKLGGMGAAGLLFEIPVTIVNLRDLLREYEPDMKW